MECIIETKARSILQFFQGLRGSLHVTFEGGTWAAWLYDLLKPHVTKLIVSNPHRNALLKEGSKSDRIDARKLAKLLRSNLLRPVYHGEHSHNDFDFKRTEHCSQKRVRELLKRTPEQPLRLRRSREWHSCGPFAKPSEHARSEKRRHIFLRRAGQR
jgi:hypothetical protein